MKRTFWRLLAAGALAIGGAMIGPAAAGGQAVSVGLAPDSISGMAGQTHTVALRADMLASGRSLSTYTVTITWDSTIVRVDSVRPGAFGTPLVNYASGGELQFTQVNTTGMTGAFTLALLHFRFVNDTIGRRTPISLGFTAALPRRRTESRALQLLFLLASAGTLALAWVSWRLVEKPAPDKAPSTLSIIGRYILQPEVFDELDRQDKGAGGEIQLTDAISQLLVHERVLAVRLPGRRFDGRRAHRWRPGSCRARRQPSGRRSTAGRTCAGN